MDNIPRYRRFDLGDGLNQMCGIAGIFVFGSTNYRVDPIELDAIRESMRKRGPDGAGSWISEDRRIGLAHRRLAILDLTDAGRQPLFSANGALAIVFNGEIYNYKEIRIELERKGCVFSSDTDTEVLLNLYADRGSAMLQDLRGMYSFAIYESMSGRLFLARDPIGIKPLYYSIDKGVFRFASQVKALLKSVAIDTSPEPAGHVGYFLLGSVPEPFTLYRGIRSLPAGSSIMVDSLGRVTNPTTFSNLTRSISRACELRQSLSDTDCLDRIVSAVQESIYSHMVSDVPMGVFLSAGLDSAMIASVSSLRGDVSAVTLGFSEYHETNLDEVPHARELARALNMHHAVSQISASEFHADRNAIIESMDQPSIDGVNTWFVAKMAARAGLKVALSGIGGDELFGSYPSFRHVPMIEKYAKGLSLLPCFGRAVRVVTEPIIRSFTSPKFAGLFEYGGTLGGAYFLRRGLYMPWELPRLLDPEMVKLGWADLRLMLNFRAKTLGINSPFHGVAALEMSLYMRNQLLRDSDWAGMAHSLEIRVPFADLKLIETVLGVLSNGQLFGKDKVAGRVAKNIPKELLQRRKTGFSMPVSNWQEIEVPHSQRGLRDWACFVYAR